MKLLVAVAHPDDESFGCGSILLRAAALGAETAVLCATRGEAGECLVDTDDLAALREAELRAAGEVLGVSEVRLLDHRDSDMVGDPQPGTLCAADPASVAGEVAAVLDELRPDVVVTLDGGDGHRDHIAMREATLAAVDAVAHPPTATYLWCVTRTRMARWADHLRATGDSAIYLELGHLGTPDEEITLVLDLPEHLDRRWQAIRAHASQQSPYDSLAPDFQRQALCRQDLKLVRGEDALFA